MPVYVGFSFTDSATCASTRTRSFAETATFSSRCFWWWWTPAYRKCRACRTSSTYGKLWCRITPTRKRTSFSSKSFKRRCTMAGKPAQTMFSICSVSAELKLAKIHSVCVISTLENWAAEQLVCVHFENLACKQCFIFLLHQLNFPSCNGLSTLENRAANDTPCSCYLKQSQQAILYCI